MGKTVSDAKQALLGVLSDGMTIASGGSGLCGAIESTEILRPSLDRKGSGEPYNH